MYYTLEEALLDARRMLEQSGLKDVISTMRRLKNMRVGGEEPGIVLDGVTAQEHDLYYDAVHDCLYTYTSWEISNSWGNSYGSYMHRGWRKSLQYDDLNRPPVMQYYYDAFYSVRNGIS